MSGEYRNPRNGRVIRPGSLVRDRREDNVRTLQVLEVVSDTRIACLVIEQTYQGETTYPNRATTMTGKRLTSSAFVPVETEEASR